MTRFAHLPPPGLYSPATSPLHRWPAGAKLGVLALALTAMVLVSSTAAVAAGALVAVLGYAVARVGWRVALAQVWPLRWFVLVLVAVQLWLAGPERTLVTAGGLVVAVALAGLVTVTTRVSAMLAAFTRVLAPLRRFDVEPERIALVLALAVRAVPVVGELARRVREAHLARGLPADPRTYAVPLVVSTLRQADSLGEALAARGLDD